MDDYTIVFLVIGGFIAFLGFAFWLGLKEQPKERKTISSHADSGAFSCPYCFHINYVCDNDGCCLCEKCGAYFKIESDDIIDIDSGYEYKKSSEHEIMNKQFFSQAEFQEIKKLLKELEHSNSKSEKKVIRKKLRSIGYYISENHANTVDGFIKLVSNGDIVIEEFFKPKQKQKHSQSFGNNPISNTKVFSFPPVVDEQSEILVLGTVPGAKSLTSGEYYADKRNLFWEIIKKLFNEGKDFDSYDEKIRCLKDNHIALWDTLKACQRRGSTDNSINDEQFNDLDVFLKQHPRIKKIVFNGKKPSSYYTPSISYEIALSTSSANLNYSEKEKLDSWLSCLKIKE